jgi:F-type H+-transporting ATPase subunit alpha
MSTFAQFGTADLDKATKAQLDLGERITEVLKQGQHVPLPLEKQVTILYAVMNHHLDDVPVENIRSVEEALLKYVETNHPDIGKAIASERAISDSTDEALKKAIAAFKQTL